LLTHVIGVNVLPCDEEDGVEPRDRGDGVGQCDEEEDPITVDDIGFPGRPSSAMSSTALVEDITEPDPDLTEVLVLTYVTRGNGVGQCPENDLLQKTDLVLKRM